MLTISYSVTCQKQYGFAVCIPITNTLYFVGMFGGDDIASLTQIIQHSLCL